MEIDLEPVPRQGAEGDGETAIPVEQFLAAALHPPYWYEGAEIELETHPGFATAPAKRPGMPLSL